MKKIFYIFLLFFLVQSFFLIKNIGAAVEVLNKEENLFNFNLSGRKIDDLVQKIAEIKDINILFPSGTEKTDAVINFSTSSNIGIEELEEYLLYFLSMAGYVLTMQNGTFVILKKTDDMLRRYPLPLYVDVPPAELPDNPGYIRAMYFLKHLRVPMGSSSGSQTITSILLSFMPDRQNGVMIDPRTNCIILTGPSNSISSAMSIIMEIDQFGIKDEIGVFPLRYTNVAVVAKLLDEVINISKDPANNQQISNSVAYSGSLYFSPQTKIVQDVKNNTLIFLGKKNAIEKLIIFIKEEIDIPQQNGTTMIHVYDLKYLESEKIQPIIQQIVNGQQNTGGQSVQGAADSTGFRSFDGVRILAEKPANAATADGKTNTKVTLGGNRLIIVANKDDYEVIKGIIDSLDKPQPQVILEVMMLDVSIDESNNFSSQFRLPSIFNLPKGAELQSVMLDGSQVIINNPGQPNAVANPNGVTPLSGIDSDLLASIEKGGGQSSGEGGDITSLANTVPRTGIVISLGEQFKNASISSILQLEKATSERYIIDNPCMVTQNNVPAKIQNVQIRRGAADLSPNNTQYGGATVVNIAGFTASIGVKITPRISYGKLDEKGKIRLNLEIDIATENFKKIDDPTNYTKYTRSLKTNTNIGSGDLLVLGGLYAQYSKGSTAKTPFLADIPIIGSFFRQNKSSEENTCLIVIIKATVVGDDDMQIFTCRKEALISSELNELALGSIKDPITRMYFKESQRDIKSLYKNKDTNLCADRNVYVDRDGLIREDNNKKCGSKKCSISEFVDEKNMNKENKENNKSTEKEDSKNVKDSVSKKEKEDNTKKIGELYKDIEKPSIKDNKN
jgi:general secretion pathway protein D